MIRLFMLVDVLTKTENGVKLCHSVGDAQGAFENSRTGEAGCVFERKIGVRDEMNRDSLNR